MIFLSKDFVDPSSIKIHSILVLFSINFSFFKFPILSGLYRIELLSVRNETRSRANALPEITFNIGLESFFFKMIF